MKKIIAGLSTKLAPSAISKLGGVGAAAYKFFFGKQPKIGKLKLPFGVREAR